MGRQGLTFSGMLPTSGVPERSSSNKKIHKSAVAHGAAFYPGEVTCESVTLVTANDIL